MHATTALATLPATAGQPPYRVEDIGQVLFSTYALPFEAASILLLVAMIGAVVIARPQLRAEAEAAATVKSGGAEEVAEQ